MYKLTTQDRYANAVAANLKGLEFVSVGICDSCEECKDRSDEASFSWRSCGVCGSKLAGDRFVWHAQLDGNLVHFDDACVDCVQYIANGEEPENWEE